MGTVIVGPDNALSGGNGEILLSEGNNGSWGMKLQYDGAANKFHISGKNGSTTYGPHFSMNRNNGRIGLGTTEPDGQMHITGALDVNSTGAGGLIIEATDGSSIGIDNNEIMARTGSGRATALYLNHDGGPVFINANGFDGKNPLGGTTIAGGLAVGTDIMPGLISVESSSERFPLYSIYSNYNAGVGGGYGVRGALTSSASFSGYGGSFYASRSSGGATSTGVYGSGDTWGGYFLGGVFGAAASDTPSPLASFGAYFHGGNGGRAAYMEGLTYQRGQAYEVVETPKGPELLASVHSPYEELIWHGSGVLDGRTLDVRLPQWVRQQVSGQIPVRVLATPVDQPAILFVRNITEEGFTIERTLIPGIMDAEDPVEISWMAIGRRRGAESRRTLSDAEIASIERGNVVAATEDQKHLDLQASMREHQANQSEEPQ